MDELRTEEQHVPPRRKGLYVLLLIVGVAGGIAIDRARPAAQPRSTNRILYYQDPMHPGYRSDRPGTAPDCGMDLVPVYVEDAGKSMVSSGKPTDGSARIDAAAQQLYGIKLAHVEQKGGTGTIQVFGRVVPDETRIYRVNLGTDGYVKETHDDAVGNFVTKNQHLAVVYSPEFLALAGGYLAAHERDPMSPTIAPGVNAPNVSQEAASVQARADRLRNIGMSDVQLQEITRTRKLPEDVYVVSPANGFILYRNISPGMRFQKQADLYTVADLSRVWIEAEVFGRDAQALHPGTIVVATLTESGQRFRAKVSNVLPEVDPSTRTLKVRLEAENPGFKLRPNMFVSVDLPVDLPGGISVPADAIVETGMAKRVFVQIAEGVFEPRNVETGWEHGDRVQIIKGLRANDIVVSSGTFLVDSESRLRSGENATSQVRTQSSEGHSGSE